METEEDPQPMETATTTDENGDVFVTTVSCCGCYITKSDRVIFSSNFEISNIKN